MMRSCVLILAAWGLAGPAGAHDVLPLHDCVPQRDLQDVVASNRVVQPVRALAAARQQVPNADVVRANLCHSKDGLVYVIVALRKDGRVVQVLIDAKSGRALPGD